MASFGNLGAVARPVDLPSVLGMHTWPSFLVFSLPLFSLLLFARLPQELNCPSSCPEPGSHLAGYVRCSHRYSLAPSFLPEPWKVAFVELACLGLQGTSPHYNSLLYPELERYYCLIHARSIFSAEVDPFVQL